jgi:uncharacterized protein (DUF58 family)
MRIRVVPSRLAIALLSLGGVVALTMLIAGASLVAAQWLAAVWAAGLLVITVVDFLITARAWKQSNAAVLRRLPDAFAIGMRGQVRLAIEATGPGVWRCVVYDYVDPTLRAQGLPVSITIRGAQHIEVSYWVLPTRRGDVTFQAADVRVRSRLGLSERLEKLGRQETRRVFPDFAQVARYAWLAGDHRLQELGIKTYQQRGEGTDFKQLSEYRIGDPVRHIDWKATLRFNKPIIREFQDERDQRVMLLVDSGRRMRADDVAGRLGNAFFDHVLNAIMLLAYVALRQGDEVGAMTFGAPPGEERSVAPRKGVHALNFLMSELYDVQPTLTHSDYVSAATALMSRQHKRALVIIVTNFRDEDSAELGNALRLLRSRHLVLLASLRERIVAELASQALAGSNASVEVASAHLYEQARRDAFNRLAARDSLMVDAEPERLGVELVNRYQAVKKAGLI